MADTDPQQHPAGEVAVELGEVAGDLGGSLCHTFRIPVAAASLVVASSSGRSAGSCWEPPSQNVPKPSCSTRRAASPACSWLNCRYEVQIPNWPRSMPFSFAHGAGLTADGPAGVRRPQSGILIGVSVVPMIGVGKSGGDDLSHLIAAVTAKDAVARGGLAAARGTRWTGRRVRGEFVKRVGGPARARVIALFGAVLALNGADTATVGAVAPQLEHALHIGNTKIGLLSSVALIVGAVFTIPVGLLVDRIKRIPILSLSIVLWSVASLLSAFAGSYSGLLLTRLLLGAVTATAGPAIASLTGDYFPARERGRVYAYILGGEIAGTAVGFIISGSVASLIDWRAAFVLLAIPGFFLARELYRTVPEPLRGGQSRLEPGVVDLERGGRRVRLEAAARPGRGRPAAAGRRPRARGGAAPRASSRIRSWCSRRTHAGSAWSSR